MADLLFEVETPLGFAVRCSLTHWAFNVTRKHPALAGQEREVERTLADPDAVRRSRKDPDVFLFYRRHTDRWVWVVVRRRQNAGFVITAYPADAMKIGETIWTK